MTGPGSAEIELKLGIDPAAMSALLRHPAVVAARRGPLRRAQVVSTYFDTPDRALAAAGIALRVRRDGRRWLQTVKGPRCRAPAGRLHVRREDEWPLAGPTLDATRFAETPWRKADWASARSGALAARFTTDFVRRTLPLGFRRRFLRAAVHRPAATSRARPPARADRRNRARAGRRRAAALLALALALAADLPVVVGRQQGRARRCAGRGAAGAGRAEPRRAGARRAGDAATASAGAGRANACSRSPATRPASSRRPTRSGCTRCASAPGDCAPAWRWPRVPAASDARSVSGRGQGAGRRAGACARLGRLRDATLPPLAAALRATRPRPGPGAACVRASLPVADRRGAARAAVASPRFHRLLSPPGSPSRAPRLDAAAARAHRPRAIVPMLSPAMLDRRHRKLARARRRAWPMARPGAARGAHRRQEAALRRRVLRGAAPAQAGRACTSRRWPACRTYSVGATTPSPRARRDRSGRARWTIATGADTTGSRRRRRR